MSKILTYICFLFSISTVYGQVNFRLIPITDAVIEAKSINKLVFVYFTAEGCPPCVVMEQNVFQNDVFGQLVGDNFIAVKSNGLTTNSKFEKMRHKIRTFPTVIYFNADGKELFRIEGKKSLEEMATITNLIKDGEIEKAIELFPVPIHEDQTPVKDSIPNGGPIKRSIQY